MNRKKLREMIREWSETLRDHETLTPNGKSAYDRCLLISIRAQMIAVVRFMEDDGVVQRVSEVNHDA